ncbi:hypothetical protein U1Q18_030847 [Sarracenia purpurea var. burkii]
MFQRPRRIVIAEIESVGPHRPVAINGVSTSIPLGRVEDVEAGGYLLPPEAGEEEPERLPGGEGMVPKVVVFRLHSNDQRRRIADGVGDVNGVGSRLNAIESHRHGAMHNILLSHKNLYVFIDTARKARRSSGNRYLSSSSATTFAAASARLIGGCQRRDPVKPAMKKIAKVIRCNPTAADSSVTSPGKKAQLVFFFLIGAVVEIRLSSG